MEQGPIEVTSSGAYPESGQASVLIKFKDGTLLSGSFWRLLKNGKTNLSSFDHEQQYGLPHPIDAFAKLQNELNLRMFAEIRLNDETGDLTLLFADNRILQVFNFTGYEVWSIRYPDGSTDYSNFILQ